MEEQPTEAQFIRFLERKAAWLPPEASIPEYLVQKGYVDPPKDLWNEIKKEGS